MSIWVRSQDKKELREISSIRIIKIYYDKKRKQYYGARFKDECENYDEAYSVEGMGIYSSEEKALKVLDMIQKHIETQNKLFGEMNANSDLAGTICTQQIRVFEMPLDSEV